MYCRVESTSTIPGEALPQTHFVWQDQEEKALSRHKEAVYGSIRSLIAAGILLTSIVTVQDIVDSYNAANDENNAFKMEVEGSDFTGVSCPKSGQIDRVSMVVSEELIAKAESIEPLSEYIEYFMLLEDIDEALYDEEAFKITSDYFNSKEIGLVVENDTDGIGLDRVTEVMPNKKQLQNLVMAMNTIPKSIIELSGLREIKLSNIIYSEKSTDQKEVETSKQIFDKEHNTWGGYYSSIDGVMGISTGSLENSGYSIKSVWHELVGHGAASKLCRPETDAEFYAIAFNFLGEEIEYTPEWQQSNLQRVVFGSGKVTESQLRRHKYTRRCSFYRGSITIW